MIVVALPVSSRASPDQDSFVSGLRRRLPVLRCPLPSPPRCFTPADLCIRLRLFATIPIKIDQEHPDVDHCSHLHIMPLLPSDTARQRAIPLPRSASRHLRNTRYFPHNEPHQCKRDAILLLRVYYSTGLKYLRTSSTTRTRRARS